MSKKPTITRFVLYFYSLEIDASVNRKNSAPEVSYWTGNNWGMTRSCQNMVACKYYARNPNLFFIYLKKKTLFKIL